MTAIPPPGLPTPRMAEPDQALRMMSAVAAVVTEPSELDRLSHLTVDTARDLLGADAACLLLWRDERGRLSPAARNDRDWDPRSSYSCMPGEGLIGQAFVANRPFTVWNYPASDYALATGVAAGIKSGLAVPLLVGGQRIGVLAVRNYYQARFTPDHIRLLTLLASLVAPALEVARGRQQRPAVRLTVRERQVLAEMMAGRPARTIAARHGISEATVRSHIRALLAKFGVNSQLAVVALARQLGLEPDLTKIGDSGSGSVR